MFTCADTTSGSETARALAVGTNSLYLVGDTLSPDLAAGVHYSTTTQDTASFSGGLQTAFATGNTNGYAIQIPISGTTVGAPSAFTFLGGTSPSGNTTLYAVAMDSTNKLVQLVGQTSATRASMPGTGVPGLSVASM